MKTNRILALILASALSIGAFTSCGEKKQEQNLPKEEEKSNTVTEETQQPQEVAPPSTSMPMGLEAYDWKYDDDEVMMTIGTHDILFDEYRFFVMGYKASTDFGDDSYWTAETNKTYKDSFIENFKLNAALILFAQENNITLGDEDYAKIDAEFANFISQLDEDGFDNLLSENYINRDTYRRILHYDLYVEKLLGLYPASEEEILAYANENFVHVQHILVSTLDENGAELEGEALEEKTKLAQELAERARNGEDFYSLVEQYGEDPGMEGNPAGYTFTYGKMVPEFEESSFSLEVDQISDPVKTDYGYHIIKKLTLEVAVGDETYNSCIDAAGANKLSVMLSDYVEKFEIVYTDAYNELTMTNIGTLTEEALRAAQITKVVSEATIYEGEEATEEVTEEATEETAEESHEGHNHE